MSTAADLGAYLADCTQPFDWADFHCGHFIGRWVARRTGRDPLTTLPHATTPLAWARAVQAAGGMPDFVSQHLHRRPIWPTQAQVGDVVLLPGAMTGGALGLCAGRTAVCLDEHGACHHVPMDIALLAWRLHERAA